MLTNFLINTGFTRDSFTWLVSRVVSGSLLVASGLLPLDQYLGTKGAKIVTVLAVVILWLAGKYDSSPLPGAPKK